MYPKGFDYVKVKTVEEALKQLRERDDAHLIAGGQSLIQLLKSRIFQPGCLVDINLISKLREVRVERDGSLRIGAMVVHNEVSDNSTIRENVPMLSHAAEKVGDLQIRNRGTIGGNICEADPSSDYYPTLLVLDARLVLRSETSSREVDIEDFYRGPFETSIDVGEMLVVVIIPHTEGNFIVEKFARRKADFPIASIAALAKRGTGGKIDGLRIAVGAQQDRPKRLKELEEGLNGQEYSEDRVSNLIAKTVEKLEPIDDLHGGQEYRRYILSGMLGRILKELLSEQKGKVR